MHIVFVCHACQFRSPTAEFIMRHLLANAQVTDVTVESAGTFAHFYGEGSAMLPEPLWALTVSLGDIGQLVHKSQTLSRKHLLKADKIFVMDKSLYKEVQHLLYLMKKQVQLAPILSNGQVNFDDYKPPELHLFNTSGVEDLTIDTTRQGFFDACKEILFGCQQLMVGL